LTARYTVDAIISPLNAGAPFSATAPGKLARDFCVVDTVTFKLAYVYVVVDAVLSRPLPVRDARDSMTCWWRYLPVTELEYESAATSNAQGNPSHVLAANPRAACTAPDAI